MRRHPGVRRTLPVVIVLATAPVSQAVIDVGSDGSDGALDLTSTNGTVVEVRVMQASGPEASFNTTPLAGTQALSTATADISFAPGYSVVQLRAFFTPVVLRASRTGKADPPAPEGLRTLNGERVTRVGYSGVMAGGARLVYVTETGRKIPVDAR